MINKRVDSAAAAVADIHDGATVMIGGFGEAGSPIELIHALIDHGAKNLTVVSNNTGSGRVGLAALIEQGLVRKLICSFPRSVDPKVFTDLYLAGGIEPGHIGNDQLRSGLFGQRRQIDEQVACLVMPGQPARQHPGIGGVTRGRDKPSLGIGQRPGSPVRKDRQMRMAAACQDNAPCHSWTGLSGWVRACRANPPHLATLPMII